MLKILRDSENSEINAQTDIYALGVTYYELLTGKNPFKTNVEAEMLSRQITMKLPYDKKIPRSIFNVILKATEKAPSKRYKSATEFKFAILDALLNMKENPLKAWVLSNWKFLVGGFVAVIILLIILFLI